jgi:hypothetical protein
MQSRPIPRWLKFGKELGALEQETSMSIAAMRVVRAQKAYSLHMEKPTQANRRFPYLMIEKARLAFYTNRREQVIRSGN